jgi:hypothetical protein
MNQDLKSIRPGSSSRAVSSCDVVCTGCYSIEDSREDWIDQEEEVCSCQVGWKEYVVRGGRGDRDGDVGAAGGNNLAVLNGGREGGSCEEYKSKEAHTARHRGGFGVVIFVRCVLWIGARSLLCDLELRISN